MSPLDYFLWGTVKEKYYTDKPVTIDHLKAYIRDAIAEMPYTRKSARKLIRSIEEAVAV